MGELATFIQHFGPITGLVMYMVYKQIVDMRNRAFDEAATATLARIEGGVKQIKESLNISDADPVEEGPPNGTDQPSP